MRFSFNKAMAHGVCKEAAQKAIWQGAESILTAAIDLTPLETGTLRRSGVVSGDIPSAVEMVSVPPDPSDPDGKPRMVPVYKPSETEQGEYAVVFVSFNTPYARRQHEEMNYKHTNGQAKYLESAYKSKTQDVIDYVHAKVREAFQKGRA